jgi:hypothetical protein
MIFGETQARPHPKQYRHKCERVLRIILGLESIYFEDKKTWEQSIHIYSDIVPIISDLIDDWQN